MLIAVEGKPQEQVDEYNPGTFPSFLLCFVDLLPVIAAVALAAGKSAEKLAWIKQPAASQHSSTRSPLLHLSCFVQSGGPFFFFKVQVFVSQLCLAAPHSPWWLMTTPAELCLRILLQKAAAWVKGSLLCRSWNKSCVRQLKLCCYQLICHRYYIIKELDSTQSTSDQRYLQLS